MNKIPKPIHCKNIYGLKKQQKVLNCWMDDMARNRPMNRIEKWKKTNLCM